MDETVIFLSQGNGKVQSLRPRHTLQKQCQWAAPTYRFFIDFTVAGSLLRCAAARRRPGSGSGLLIPCAWSRSETVPLTSVHVWVEGRAPHGRDILVVVVVGFQGQSPSLAVDGLKVQLLIAPHIQINVRKKLSQLASISLYGAFVPTGLHCRQHGHT